jgi:YidC/Oxa1 family membrane protein insertase
MEEQNNKNLILAMVLSALVMIVWFVLFPPPEPPVQPATTVAETTPATTTDPLQGQTEVAPVAEAPRLRIETEKLAGSISLRGGRIDDLSLKTYRETLDPASPEVRLLSPVGEKGPYYALFGWAPAGSLGFDDVPGSNTDWTQVSGGTLSPGKPVTLQWKNGKGLVFTRDIAVDEDYMFTVTETVENTGPGDVTLASYGQIARHGMPTDLQNIFVVHEGAIARTDGEYSETDYADIPEFDVVEREGNPAEVVEAATDGWVGFTDHYWMSVLVPEQGKPHTRVTKYFAKNDIYQTEVRNPALTVAAGQKASTVTRLFAGAKEWATIRAYEAEGGIPGFIDSIDWGWFYFLTKPIFAVLHWLNQLIGNMGWAIIALTFVLKIIVLPLAYKSYVSMARMKELQPEMEALKERSGDDRQKMQREMMQLYKDKKVNPAAGCLPILIQIPIFFALYKVIFVTLELRHAPFFGWLNDLSAPDSSSIFNLFGLLPWDAPMQGTLLHLIFIGVLPILLGITMWLQQKLNPAPTDPVQASIFAWMPWVFMFMLGGFASGLVVYWITNNTITFVQQYLIMWSHGKRPDIFGNIRAAKAAKAVAKAAPPPPAPAAKKGKK